MDGGYVFVIIGRSTTVFVQANDTQLHKPLKSDCRKEESKLMLRKLQNDQQKVPAPGRNEMMRLLVNSNEDVKIDVQSALKSVRTHKRT